MVRQSGKICLLGFSNRIIKILFRRWDTRKLNEPLERLYMDPLKTDEQVLSRSYGISVLEYETTMPTKFM